MKKNLLVIALSVLSSTVLAQTTAPTVCDPATYDHILFPMPLNPPCPVPRGMPAFNATDGGIEFEWGATVDFAAWSGNSAAVGPLAGYVWIKVSGNWFLMPFFSAVKPTAQNGAGAMIAVPVESR